MLSSVDTGRPRDDKALRSDSHASASGRTSTMINRPNTGDLDLNMVGVSGFNCLHAACGSGNIEMTEFLLFRRYVCSFHQNQCEFD